jgi:hypothetical protein
MIVATMTAPSLDAPRRRRADGLVPCCLAVVAALAACTAPTVSPSASPTGPEPTGPAPTTTLAGGCPVAEQTGALRSNTLVDLDLSSDGLSDTVVLTLGEPASNPTGSGTGLLKAGVPPFLSGGSGEEVEVLGEHFVEVRLSSMAITDDNGVPTYEGPSSLKPDMLAVKQVELTEAFEGVYNFVIGYDGNGCVDLVADETGRVVITIGH